MKGGLVLPLAAGLALAACSKDFDAFSFGDAGDAASGDAATAVGDGSTPTGRADGAAATGDASQPDAAPAQDGGADAGNVTDAGGAAITDGGTPNDAGGGPDPGECAAAAAPVSPAGKDACDPCACGPCLVPTYACLASGDAAQDALCAAVLACAWENACQGWDCYCNLTNCGAGSADGDGPCVDAMNAAAGGRKAEVMMIWGGDDRSEPLLRAIDAIDCSVGLNRRSPNGPTTGMCAGECL